MYLCREKTTVWDVMMGAHAGKNLFDIMIKVTPVPEGQLNREPSVISLSGSVMSALNITHMTERPFECEQHSLRNIEEGSRSEVVEYMIAEDHTASRHSAGDVGRGQNDGGEVVGEHSGPTSVVVEVVMEEATAN